MGKREQDQKLTELRDKGIEIYSISRIDAINHCLYAAYRTYKLHERGENNVYAILGGDIHDVLEGITNGEKTEADLLPAVEDELTDLEMLGLDFPKDQMGGDSIRQNWIANISNFCVTYEAPKNKGDLKAEELFIFKTPKGRYLQGYIDLQRIRSDGSIDIVDYKSSSLYKGADLKSHQRQLILYVLGKEQEGYKVNSASWMFFKYVSVEYKGYKTSRSKNETLISKVMERRKVITELLPMLVERMNKAQMDSLDIEVIVDQMLESQTIDAMPKELREDIKIKPYVLEADLSDEAKKECIEYIDNTIDMWESLSDNEAEYEPRKFTKRQKNGKVVSDIFFCTSLCSHFKQCPHIKDYLDGNVEEDDDEDLF